MFQLRETVQIVSAQLDGKLSEQDKDIVEVEVEEFMVSTSSFFFWKSLMGKVLMTKTEEYRCYYCCIGDTHGAECGVTVSDSW